MDAYRDELQAALQRAAVAEEKLKKVLAQKPRFTPMQQGGLLIHIGVSIMLYMLVTLGQSCSAAGHGQTWDFETFQRVHYWTIGFIVAVNLLIHGIWLMDKN